MCCCVVPPYVCGLMSPLIRVDGRQLPSPTNSAPSSFRPVKAHTRTHTHLSPIDRLITIVRRFTITSWSCTRTKICHRGSRSTSCVASCCTARCDPAGNKHNSSAMRTQGRTAFVAIRAPHIDHRCDNYDATAVPLY